MSRFAILLDNPKSPHHVGQAVRLAACYGGELVMVAGMRCKREVDAMSRIPREERMKGYADVHLAWYSSGSNIDKPITHGGRGYTPVCVEVDPSAELLPQFIWPERPLLVFGPEDGDVRQSYRHQCHRFVRIPSQHCLNLGHAMATSLYDFSVKSEAWLTLGVST